ncbi:MAG: DUF6702 family protein [Pirellula sp.]|jgi:hypothetical protein
MFSIGKYRSLTAMLAMLSAILGAMTVASPSGSSMAFFPHPFHVCIGQMEWNDSDRWEVALRVHPQDLEKELSKVVGKSISMEDDEFPKFVTDFLNDQFFIARFPIDIAQQEIDQRVTEMSKGFLRRSHKTATDNPALEATADDASGEDPMRSSLKWIGMESERGWIWIYLELYPPRLEATSTSQDWLVHQLFLETVERQENSVVIYPQPRTVSSRKYSLQFKKGQPSAMMKPREGIK